MKRILSICLLMSSIVAFAQAEIKYVQVLSHSCDGGGLRYHRYALLDKESQANL